jgi:endonuclease/exonuclease/phosphatase family metal-dependent hydrolase
VTRWRDRIRALDDVVAGIRRAAVSVLIDSGGAFEFSSHQFTDAELASLPASARPRVMAGLRRLRTQMVHAVASRKLERNLLIATWCLNKFGRHAPLPESLFYAAQVISTFDVVSLQEIHRDMDALRRLIAILGPEWGYLISDITEGPAGNLERCAILHYRPRVAFEHISGDVVLPETMLVNGKQFARKPLLASFRSGDFRFRVATARIHFGGGAPKDRSHGVAECRTLARFLARLAARDRENIVLAGNFNTAMRDAPAIRAFREEGFSLPARIIHPSHLLSEKYYSLLGFLLNSEAESPTARIGSSGIVNPFESVFRDDDVPTYATAVRARQTGAPARGLEPTRFYRYFWRTEQLSDHLPLWVQLELKQRRSKLR